MNGRRRCRFGIFQLGGRNTPCKQRQDRADNVLRIDGHIMSECITDAFKKGISARQLVGVRMPAFVVEAAQQQWQLGAEVDRLVTVEAIPQGVQGCEQR